MIIEMPKPFPGAGDGHHQLPVHPGEGELPRRTCGWWRRRCGRAIRRWCITGRCGFGRRDRTGWRTAVPGEAYEEGSEANGRREGRQRHLLGKFNPGLGRAELRYRRLGQVRSRRVRTSCSNCTTRPSARRRLTGPKWGWCSRRIRRQTRYCMSPDTPAAFNLVIPAGDSNAEVVSEVTRGRG